MADKPKTNDRPDATIVSDGAGNSYLLTRETQEQTHLPRELKAFAQEVLTSDTEGYGSEELLSGIKAVMTWFGQKFDAKYMDPAADPNGDGVVNSLDLAIYKKKLQELGSPVVSPATSTNPPVTH